MSLAKIGNKIFDKKVELSKEQIELNKVDDLRKRGGKIGGAIMSKEADILSLASDIKKESDKYGSLISEMKKLEKAAKDLGVDKVAKDASDAISHYENKMKRADQMLSAVKGAIKR